MVGNITSLTGNGLKDWFVQRVTALIFGVYAVFISYTIVSQEMTYSKWQALFQSAPMKIFTVLATLSFIFHAWIGIWTVTTDYVKCTLLRIVIQLAVILSLIVILLAMIAVLWRV